MSVSHVVLNQHTVDAHVKAYWHALRSVCDRLHHFDYRSWDAEGPWCTHSDSRLAYVLCYDVYSQLTSSQPVSSRVPTIIEGEGDRSSQVCFWLLQAAQDTLTNLSLVARTCHLIFIVLDVLKPLNDKKIIEQELEGFGIRLNKKPPNITVKKKDKGGIAISNTVPLTNMDIDEIKAVLSEMKYSNCDVMIREPNATVDDIVDVIEGNR